MVCLMGSIATDEAIAAAEPRAYEGHAGAINALIAGVVARGRVAEARRHAERIATLGYLEAYSALANHLHAYDGLQPNDAAWADLMSRYAGSDRPGYPNAAFVLATHLDDAGQQTAALQWYRRAAEGSHEAAKIQLGYAYALGIGVTKNPLEAARWFMRSLSAEPTSTLTGVDTGEWPVSREEGWRDWPFLGELMEPLQLDERIALVHLVSQRPVK